MRDREEKKKKKLDDKQLVLKKQGSSFDLRMDEQEDDSLVIRDVSSYYKNKDKQALPSQKLQLTNGSYSRNPAKGQGLTIGGDSFGSLRQIS